jgi:hypothetical protein
MAEASSKEKQPPGAPGQRGRGWSGARGSWSEPRGILCAEEHVGAKL